LVLTIQASFLTAVAIATITRLIVYATTCLALPVLRRRSGMPTAPFSLPLGILASVLSTALIIWLLTNIDFAKEGIPILIAAILGFIIFLVNRTLARRQA